MVHLTLRQRTLVLAAGASLALGACGGDDASTDKLPKGAEVEKKVKDSSADLERSSKELKQQGADLQKQAGDLKTYADETQQKVKDGALSQAEAEKLIRERTDKLRENAKTTASDAIETLKGVDGLPDDAKKALEDAKKQLPSP